MVFYMGPAGHMLGQFIAESQIDKDFASLFRERFIKPMSEAVEIIFDRGVERGEIDQNLNRELVLDLIHGLAIYRLNVRHASLEDKLADEMVSILFGGLENRSPERPGIAGKTRHDHTKRIDSKLAERTAVWLDYRRDVKCGL
jgi:Tetracyclin repressor-like, C-terminal domain